MSQQQSRFQDLKKLKKDVWGKVTLSSKVLHENKVNNVIVKECTEQTKQLVYKETTLKGLSISEGRTEYKFKKEFIETGKIDSTYIVKVLKMEKLDAEADPNKYETTFYLMEKGRPFAKCKEEDPRREIVRYCFEAALGLKQLHDKGYAHRDIKSDNIVVFEQKEPFRHHIAKLIDFGLVRDFNPKQGQGPDDPLYTERDVAVGTEGYQSPEAFPKSVSSIGFKRSQFGCCDTWAFGIMLLQLVYDVQKPDKEGLYGMYHDTAEIVEKRILDRLRIDHSEDKQLIKEIAKCLVYNVDGRETHIDNIIKALERYLKYLSIEPIFPLYFETNKGLKTIRRRTKKIDSKGYMTGESQVLYMVEGLYQQRCRILQIKTKASHEQFTGALQWQRPEFVQLVEEPQVKEKIGDECAYWLVFEDWESELQKETGSKREAVSAWWEVCQNIHAVHKAGFAIGEQNFRRIALVKDGMLLRPKFLRQDMIKPLDEEGKKTDCERFKQLIKKFFGTECKEYAKLQKCMNGQQGLDEEELTQHRLLSAELSSESKGLLEGLPELCRSICSLETDSSSSKTGPLLTELKELRAQVDDTEAKIFRVDYRHNRRKEGTRLCIYKSRQTDVDPLVWRYWQREAELGQLLLGRYKHFLKYYECNFAKHGKDMIAYFLTEPYNHLNEIFPRTSSTELHVCFKGSNTQESKNLWWCYHQLSEIFYELRCQIYGGQGQSDEKEIQNMHLFMKDMLNGIHKDMRRLLVNESTTFEYITPFSLVFTKDPVSGKYLQAKFNGLGAAITQNEYQHTKSSRTAGIWSYHDYIRTFYHKRFGKEAPKSFSSMSDYFNFLEDLLRLYCEMFRFTANDFSKAYIGSKVGTNAGKQVSKMQNSKLYLKELFNEWEGFCSQIQYLLVNYPLDIVRSYLHRPTDKQQAGVHSIAKQQAGVNAMIYEVPTIQRTVSVEIREVIYKIYLFLIEELSNQQDLRKSTDSKQNPEQKNDKAKAIDALNFGCGMYDTLMKIKRIRSKIQSAGGSVDDEIRRGSSIYKLVNKEPEKSKESKQLQAEIEQLYQQRKYSLFPGLSTAINEQQTLQKVLQEQMKIFAQSSQVKQSEDKRPTETKQDASLIRLIQSVDSTEPTTVLEA